MSMDNDKLVYDWNIEGEVAKPHKVILNDETLRDGLQSPSITDPTIQQKIEIIHLMESLGIGMVNLGLPGAGPRAVEDVTRLAEEIRDNNLKIRPNCAARTMAVDIEPIANIQDKTGVAITAATFLGSSAIRQYTENWTMDKLLECTEEAVTLCVKRELECMFVTEDTTRAHPETIDKLYRTAIECGARRIVVCDTVGHATPHGVHMLIRFIKDMIKSTGETVTIDWHGHNDRGLGLINAIAAIEAGVDVVHGAALGIGERCGNSAMDQLIVNLKLMGYLDDGVDLTLLPKYVQKVSEYCVVPVPRNYPVMGPDAFETATGVHAAAVIKALKKGDTWLANRVYSGVPADVFGLAQSITIGPMSGRSNVIFWLGERNIEAGDGLVDRIFNKAKHSATILTVEEIMAEVEAMTAA
jgi:isopropylmalate/homocitrate/citramalate synthase